LAFKVSGANSPLANETLDTGLWCLFGRQGPQHILSDRLVTDSQVGFGLLGQFDDDGRQFFDPQVDCDITPATAQSETAAA